MNKVRSLLIGVVLAGLAIGLTGGLQGVNTASATELDFGKLLSMLEPAVVKITPMFEARDVETGQVAQLSFGSGSGFIIGGGDVVTDWHVVESAVLGPLFSGASMSVQGREFILTGRSVIQIQVPDKKNPQEFEDPPVVIGIDAIKKGNSLHDLALLGAGIRRQGLWFGDSSVVKKGQGGFAIGYPAPNGELTVTEHQISNHFTETGSAAAIEVDGKRYHLLPRFPGLLPNELRPRFVVDREFVWRLAMAPAPADFELIEVNVRSPGRDPETGELVFTVCEARVEAESVQCVIAKEPREFLQTDDAIDAGNSGGPIFNWNGQVIGVSVLDPSSVIVVVDLETGTGKGLLRTTVEYHTTSNKTKEILGLSR